MIVHNGGAANSIYLAKVLAEFRDVISAGKDLTPSREYLNDRIDRFEKVCVLIGAEMWKQADPSNEERATTLNSLSYQHLLAERYIIARSLSFFVAQDRQVSEIHRSVAQLNLWLCDKRLGNWATVKSEVHNADYSAKNLRFQLGRLALLEDVDAFYEMLPRALQADEITLVELQDFPIMREVRTDARFAEYVSESPQLTPGIDVKALSSGDEPNAEAVPGV